jgi:hypothetical protein
VRTIDEGGMGAVYEAIHEPFERRVVLKVLLRQYVQKREVFSRFFNEERAVNMIDHPSIVQVSNCGQAPDGTAFRVMEYCQGDKPASGESPGTNLTSPAKPRVDSGPLGKRPISNRLAANACGQGVCVAAPVIPAQACVDVFTTDGVGGALAGTGAALTLGGVILMAWPPKRSLPGGT